LGKKPQAMFMPSRPLKNGRRHQTGGRSKINTLIQCLGRTGG